MTALRNTLDGMTKSGSMSEVSSKPTVDNTNDSPFQSSAAGDANTIESASTPPLTAEQKVSSSINKPPLPTQQKTSTSANKPPPPAQPKISTSTHTDEPSNDALEIKPEQANVPKQEISNNEAISLTGADEMSKKSISCSSELTKDTLSLSNVDNNDNNILETAPLRTVAMQVCRGWILKCPIGGRGSKRNRFAELKAFSLW